MYNMKTQDNYNFKVIAHYEGQLKQKFGVPRQAGLAKDLKGRIVFEKEYRDRSAFRGLETRSHIWLIFVFSENKAQTKFKPTVRPPRLGGDKRMGVFATRSPNRPNRIGLSAVKIDKLVWDDDLGPLIYVSGADLVDKTPILDIKPYIPYADSIETAQAGVFSNKPQEKLETVFKTDNIFNAEDTKAIKEVLAQDPRPSYQDDSDREYGFIYKDYNLVFKVKDNAAYVIRIEKL